MAQNEDVQKWFKEVMSKIIEKLELDVDKVQYELLKSNDRAMTTIHFVLLQFENKTRGENKELSIVLKRPLQGYLGEYTIRPEFQFNNEILFYQMYARPDENYARCIYAKKQPLSDTVIVLEDVTKREYHPCPHQYRAPLEYTLAVIREMGRFHGKGYAMKKLQPEKFFDIVSRLQEVKYLRKTPNIYIHLCNINSPRAVEYLRRQGYDTVFCDKMEAILSNAFDEVMMKTVERPLEPLSTLCHGDFTLDNCLFRTKDDGQIRAMPIDFAFFRYSTPVVDLSTYLLLHCSQLRKERFFEIMRAYHEELKKYLLEAGVWDIKKYSYEAILEDYRKGALFGFVIASYHVPLLLGCRKPDTLRGEIVRMGMVKYLEHHKYDGGDKVCKILADTLLHLKDLGCLKHMLE
ncbi:hypothetical protein P5V15_012064 [Pogonomyrmex californicus]